MKNLDFGHYLTTTGYDVVTDTVTINQRISNGTAIVTIHLTSDELQSISNYVQSKMYDSYKESRKDKS